MTEIRTFSTLAEAQGALGQGSFFIAGGTLVMRGVNYGMAGLERLVRVTDPALREIRTDGARIRIGAGATMADLAAHRDLEALAPAARSVGGPAVRNMGTLGGNLFARSPYGDLATALLALDAEVIWADGRSEPIDEMLAARGCESRGLVAAVTVPRVRVDEVRFRKVVRTRPVGAAVLSIAAWLPREAGRLGDVRIAFGAMGPRPLRARAAETALRGARLDEAGIGPALAACLEGLDPQDDAIASSWYRREVAPVHLKRMLLEMR